MKNKKPQNNESEFIRVRTPKKNEILGIVEQRTGGRRMTVRCLDGKTRTCRVPGRLQRSLWLREGDVVIIEPWEFENDKGDILFKYYPNQVSWLKRKGFLDGIEEL